MEKQVPAPFKPFVVNAEDTRNIDKMFLNETAKETPVVSNMDAEQKRNQHFEQFTYAENQMTSNTMAQS